VHLLLGRLPKVQGQGWIPVAELPSHFCLEFACLNLVAKSNTAK
jgi:hypothetical protein